MVGKTLRLLVENKFDEVGLLCTKPRTIDAEKHADDLLKYAQRKESERVFERWWRTSTKNNPHCLRGPMGIRSAVPTPCVAVTLHAESRSSRAFLLIPAAKFVRVLASQLLFEAYLENSVVVEGRFRRYMLE